MSSLNRGLATLVAAAAAFACAHASATGFSNGGFESGNTTGWTTGGGYRGSVDNAGLNPADFLPGGSLYNASANRSAVVTAGAADHTDGQLNQVYSGSYAFRAEDTINGGNASAISQRVNGYTDDKIFFAWAAVLEGAHGTDEASTFKLVLRDETLGTDLISRSFNAANDGSGVDGRFTESSDHFFYTRNWQIEQLNLDASNVGHDFSLTLLAADCWYTGHAGTVYLDGFGAVIPTVPEPETYALMLGGLAAVGAVARRRRKG